MSLGDDRIRLALQELRRERDQVERLRLEHRTLVGSRFYALRSVWIALQGLFGWGGRRDAYMTWNTGGQRATTLKPAASPLNEDDVLAAWRSRAAGDPVGEPLVSVVIPVYNHLGDTLRCLDSIARTWFDSLPVQFIVIDDASTDRSQHVLPQFPTIEYLRNTENIGFLRSCNHAAGRALGKYICFLNNDTIVCNAWLDHLVSTVERDDRIGAVGAKLVYPNGTLQEAGGIIWRDGSGWNYGRGGNPSDCRYNFERDVDYCSGAALLVRRDLFEQLGGFDLTFAPAYYEDADLCFAIRNAGYRVVYQPRAEVVHLEGVTSGTEIGVGVKQYQEHNRPMFERKWKDALQRHLPHDPARAEEAARRLVHRPRVLIVDSYVPMHDKEAGSNRIMHIIEFLRSSGYGIVFLPDNYAALQPYTAELQALGVEVLYHTDGAGTPEEALKGALEQVDCVWICRPELFDKYGPLARASSTAKILYDTIDLHYVRKRREAEMKGPHVGDWRRYEAMELAAARSADVTIVVSDPERAVLLERGITNVEVIPTIHNRAAQAPSRFADTRDLLFIGNYNHTPNADGAVWLCREIMPRVWKTLPDVTVWLLGSDPTDEVRALASRRVRVPGYVPDVSRHFESARLFLAPLRFGAGLKGKVGHAMSYGLPIVATDVAVEGFGFGDGVHCSIANTAQAFADAIVHAYNDESAWEHTSARLLERSEAFSSRAVGMEVLRILSGLASGVYRPSLERIAD